MEHLERDYYIYAPVKKKNRVFCIRATHVYHSLAVYIAAALRCAEPNVSPRVCKGYRECGARDNIISRIPYIPWYVTDRIGFVVVSTVCATRGF